MQKPAPAALNEAAVLEDAAAAPGRPRRAVKPSVRLLAVGGEAEASAPAAAVGRRLRVYWPDEGDFFHGEVAGYEPRSGLHTIFYEDGDVEEVRLASERFEWIATPRPGAGGAPPGGAQEPEGNGRRLVRKVAGEWPQAGDLLWGRVKGHGWWPGMCVEIEEKPPAVSPSAVSVSFFDHTSGWVIRNDCLPFAENFEVLHGRKSRVPAFMAAAKAARQVWVQQQSELPPAKRTKLCALGGRGSPGDPLETRSQAFAALKLKLAPRGPPSKPRWKPQRAKLWAGDAARGGFSLLGTACGLSRRMDDLHARLAPLVRQAQISVTDQLRAGQHGHGDQSFERKLLLSQLEALTGMPRLLQMPPLPEQQTPGQPGPRPHAESEPEELEEQVALPAPEPYVDVSATDVDDDY